MSSFSRLRRTFQDHFDAVDGLCLARAPGRVNLVGDHTDYNGLPVFPMAIQREVRLLFRPRTGPTVRLVNVDARFPPRTFELRSPIAPHPAGDWANYVKAAAQALMGSTVTLRGFDAVVASDVPVASGLSSSSALVVAAALALLHGNRRPIERPTLMSLLARGERYVGVQGGGMDQAICLGGRAGTAFRIDFDPLRLSPTRVPDAWRFVIGSSLVDAPKSGAVRGHYNQRTRECRRALEALSPRLGRGGPVRSYREALGLAPAPQLVSLAMTALDEPLGRRFRHVITEAGRVTAAVSAMQADDPGRFGGLMLESHRSLREDFEVSCDPLDALVEIATTAGAAGARLTGAGFGGCVVALCGADRVPDVLTAIEREFYGARRDPGAPSSRLLVAAPSDGASVVTL